MSGHITIVSCGLGLDSLTLQHHAAVNKADVLAGGERLIAWFTEFSGEKIAIGAHAVETVENLIKIAANKNVAVLASGDALFFGVARLFINKVPSEQLTIIPNVTAAQSALAKLQVPWQSARFFSIHGRSANLPAHTILQAPVAVVYCDSIRTPPKAAAKLISANQSAALRPAAIAANLGTDDESLIQGTLAEIAQLDCSGMSMLILLPPQDIEFHNMTPKITLGLPDDNYQHEANLITHAEIRAVVLSKLQLRPGVMWDLGAGSGSVSVEAAGLCEGLQVYAVEKKQARCAHIQENATNANCSQYEVIQNDILLAITTLPKPNIVFIGGGGEKIIEIIEHSYNALIPGGTLVATSVLEETRSALMVVMPEIDRDTIEISVRHSTPLGKSKMMKPDNPVCIFIFKKD